MRSLVSGGSLSQGTALSKWYLKSGGTGVEGVDVHPSIPISITDINTAKRTIGGFYHDDGLSYTNLTS